MANTIRRCKCPACGKTDLQSLPNWRLRQLCKDKEGMPLFLCVVCALQFATIVFCSDNANREHGETIKPDLVDQVEHPPLSPGPEELPK